MMRVRYEATSCASDGVAVFAVLPAAADCAPVSVLSPSVDVAVEEAATRPKYRVDAQVNARNSATHPTSWYRSSDRYATSAPRHERPRRVQHPEQPAISRPKQFQLLEHAVGCSVCDDDAVVHNPAPAASCKQDHCSSPICGTRRPALIQLFSCYGEAHRYGGNTASTARRSRAWTTLKPGERVRREIMVSLVHSADVGTTNEDHINVGGCMTRQRDHENADAIPIRYQFGSGQLCADDERNLPCITGGSPPWRRGVPADAESRTIVSAQDCHEDPRDVCRSDDGAHASKTAATESSIGRDSAFVWSSVCPPCRPMRLHPVVSAALVSVFSAASAADNTFVPEDALGIVMAGRCEHGRARPRDCDG